MEYKESLWDIYSSFRGKRITDETSLDDLEDMKYVLETLLRPIDTILSKRSHKDEPGSRKYVLTEAGKLHRYIDKWINPKE